jgi:hypothetical protein
LTHKVYSEVLHHSHLLFLTTPTLYEQGFSLRNTALLLSRFCFCSVSFLFLFLFLFQVLIKTWNRNTETGHFCSFLFLCWNSNLSSKLPFLSPSEQKRNRIGTETESRLALHSWHGRKMTCLRV